jgi:hypothetical protein
VYWLMVALIYGPLARIEMDLMLLVLFLLQDLQENSRRVSKR